MGSNDHYEVPDPVARETSVGMQATFPFYECAVDGWHLYCVVSSDWKYFKVGKTKNMPERMAGLGRILRFIDPTLTLIRRFDFVDCDAGSHEKRFHSSVEANASRYDGEWYHIAKFLGTVDRDIQDDPLYGEVLGAIVKYGRIGDTWNEQPRMGGVAQAVFENRHHPNIDRLIGVYDDPCSRHDTAPARGSVTKMVTLMKGFIGASGVLDPGGHLWSNCSSCGGWGMCDA